MCGIVGIAGYRDDELVRRMTAAVSHRGPDDHGYFFSDEASLGMRRLSIIDLAGGHQPMLTEAGKVAIVFNGEVYNYRELRQDLINRGRRFQTNSDTEVLLQGYIEWGLNVISKLNGMFALAITDFRGRPTVHLVRDRFGVKPLYYRLSGTKLTFGSEVKAIIEDRTLHRELNPQAVHQYLKLRYVPGQECLLKGVSKLPAGCCLSYTGGAAAIHRYWSVCFPSQKLDLSLDEAVDRVGTSLRTSIRRRLVADVPVGAFLSGGVDSSVMVALMREAHSGDLNTFSVGFGGRRDETSLAAETARLLETNHHEVICSDSDMALIDDIAWSLDEPIGDAIVLPMFLLARAARQHVKVVLAGEGADEVFGGYLFQKTLALAGSYRARVPGPLRAAARLGFSAVPHQLVDMLFEYPAALGREGKRKVGRFLRDIETRPLSELFRDLISLYTDEELDNIYASGFRDALAAGKGYVDDTPFENRDGSLLDRILSLSYRDWLPDDILMKLDRMTMANSLEGREPFLDHEMVDLVNSLPDKYKIRGWRDKLVLRLFAGRLLPGRTAFRKKQPFYIPIDEYFRGTTFQRVFRDFREDNRLAHIFSESYLESVNLDEKTLVRSKQLFSLIMLNAWMRRYDVQFN